MGGKVEEGEAGEAGWLADGGRGGEGKQGGCLSFWSKVWLTHSILACEWLFGAHWGWDLGCFPL